MTNFGAATTPAKLTGRRALLCRFLTRLARETSVARP
jgi:hypothetical protein